MRIDADAALADAAAADRRIAVERGGGRPGAAAVRRPDGVQGLDRRQGVQEPERQRRLRGQRLPAGQPGGGAGARARRGGARDHGLLGVLGHDVGQLRGNAWNTDYTPGGSSQGSGAAAIGRLACACFGEETGGSITYPSAAKGRRASSPHSASCRYGRDAPHPGLRRDRSDRALGRRRGADPQRDARPRLRGRPADGVGSEPVPDSCRSRRARAPSPCAGTTIGISKTDWLNAGGFKANVDPQSLYGADQLAAFNRLRDELTALGATVKEFTGLNMEDSPRPPTRTSRPTRPGSRSRRCRRSTAPR